MPNRIETTCCYCGVGCGITLEQDRHGTLNLSGTESHPSSLGKLCSKGRTLHHTASDRSARLQHPQIRNAEGNLEQFSWDSAMAMAAGKFADIIAKHGPDAVAFYGSGQCLTEEYYCINKLAKGFIGTNNFDTNSRLCMSSAVVAYKQSLGADAPPISYEDLECNDVCLIGGANPAWAHPIIFQRLMEHRAKHPEHRLIVIDPRRTDSAEVADLHLAVKPGTDVALLLGITQLLIENGHIDEDWIAANTTGWEELKATCAEWTPERCAEVCDVPAADIINAAEWIGFGERFLSMWTMGFNQSTVGVDKGRALINLHLATGTIGKPGCGPFSLTGQPNAMGGREVGGMANLCSNHRELSNDAERKEVAQAWGVDDIPAKPGLTATALFQAIEEGSVKAVWVIATNPAASIPDTNQVIRALQKAELVVVQDAFHSDTADYADILLPAATWLEKDGTMTNSERRIAKVRKLLDPPGEAKADWRIIADLANRLGHGQAFAYADEAEIFAEHAALSKGRDCDISGLSYERLADGNTFQWPVPDEGHPGTDRLYTDFKFETPDGKARFAAPVYHDDSEPRDADFPLILTSGRLRDQWHTQTRSGTVSRLRDHEDRPWLDLHPEDAKEHGFQHGDAVSIVSRRGSCIAAARINQDIRQGCVFLSMHWGPLLAGPEGATNACTSPRVDPASKQPELKTAAVRLEPALQQGEKLVIVGGGAAALALIEELADSPHEIHLVAEEDLPIYDRVQLPHLIDTSRIWDDLVRMTPEQMSEIGVTRHVGLATNVHRKLRTLSLISGEQINYDRLIIATGSRPLTLLLGKEPRGVHALRTREHAEAIIDACQPGTKVAILGGGLLGLEVADALNRRGVTVHVVQRSNKLMGRQLDDTSAKILMEYLEDQGINIHLNHPPAAWVGNGHLTGIRCSNGETIPCNVAIVAAGTTPNSELGQAAGIGDHWGIHVDDTLTTADDRIHAVGECASWRGKRVGTTAGARAQAMVLAARLKGDRTRRFSGHTEANILKIQGLPVASVGTIQIPADDHETEIVLFSDLRRNVYQRCLVRHDRLIGALTIGTLDGFSGWCNLVAKGTELENIRDSLLRSGGEVSAVDGELVCSCNQIGAGTIEKAIASGICDLKELCTTTKAGTGCGSCRPQVAKLLNASAEMV